MFDDWFPTTCTPERRAAGDYPQFLAEIKARIAGARTRAVLAQAWPDWEVCSQAVSKPP